MQSTIFAGLRNPVRDQAIVDALLEKSVSELAAELKLAPSTVRAAAKRMAAMSTYRLTLTGGVKTYRSAKSPPSPSSARH